MKGCGMTIFLPSAIAEARFAQSNDHDHNDHDNDCFRSHFGSIHFEMFAHLYAAPAAEGPDEEVAGVGVEAEDAEEVGRSSGIPERRQRQKQRILAGGRNAFEYLANGAEEFEGTRSQATLRAGQGAAAHAG